MMNESVARPCPRSGWLTSLHGLKELLVVSSPDGLDDLPVGAVSSEGVQLSGDRRLGSLG